MKFLLVISLTILWLSLFQVHKCQEQNVVASPSSDNSKWRDEKVEDEEEKIEAVKFKPRKHEADAGDRSVKEQLALFFTLATNSDKSNEQLSFDGWFHDLNDIHKGIKGSPLTRQIRSTTSASSADMPNVFKLSESILKSYEHESFSNGGKNLLFVYFGFFVLNEIVDSRQPRCPPSYREIAFPEHYLDKTGQEVIYQPTTNHSYMILNKLEYCKSVGNGLNNPPRKANFRTVWIDGETLYGDSKFCSDYMRTFRGGQLVDFQTLLLRRASGLQCFNAFGSTMVNENPFTWTVHSIWLRWHNIVADIIAHSSPHLSDEAIYQEARKFTVATMQHVIMDEWLPVLLGKELQPYPGHQPEENAQISDLFESIVPTYLYSLVSSSVFKVNSDCSNPAVQSLIRTCNSYDDPVSILGDEEKDQILVGLLLQSAQKDDHTVVEDIQRFAKGPMDFSREDLIAISIQQTRDFAMPNYLSIREKLGLNSSYDSFEQLARDLWPFATRSDKFVSPKLKTLYHDVHMIDASIGALLENDGNGPGQLIAHLAKEQFDQIRRGDRFYFENPNSLFNDEQIQHIKEIKFSHVIKMVSKNINDGLVPAEAFLLPSDKQNQLSSSCRQSLQGIIETYQCSSYGLQRSPLTCLSLDSRKSKSALEECSSGHRLDYFVGSELFFMLTFTFLATFIISIILLLKFLVYRKNCQSESLRVKTSNYRKLTISDNTTIAQEWVSEENESYRSVEVVLNNKNKSIKVRYESGGRVLRSIYLKDVPGKVWIQCNHNKSQDHILIRVPKEYDLVLKFDSYYEREKFIVKLEAFLMELNIPQERNTQELNSMFKFAYTKAKRQRHLEQFFRIVFSHAFNKKTNENIDMKTAKGIIETELTQFEFAEALSMRPESTFVQQMFSLIDKDNNGYISFREFLDVMVIFAKGSPEQKIKLMFDMYDVNQNGRLSINDFKGMIKSLLEIANQSISPIEMDQTIHSMLNEVGFTSKKELSFDEFNKLFNNYKEELGYSELNFDLSNLANLQAIDKRQSALFRANDTIIRAYSYFGGKSGPDFSNLGKQAPTFLKIETQELLKEPDWLISWIRFVDARKQEMFCIVLYTLLVIFIFVDKSYYYTYLNEASGLRQVAGLGVTLTRGSASVLMFTFSTILLTMCRNLITFFRETFLHQYIPFDGAVSFHKYIACWAFVMSLLHAAGHCFNFYHISTQRPLDINCLFREIYFLDNELPKFHTWLFKTPTGITGILLLCLLFLIYIFAIQYSRRHVFNAFWRTHNLYPILYILIVVHGLGKLIQPPIFYFYFLLPITLFTLDRLISASRKKIEISVVRATLHPSNVTHLEFQKPPGLIYKSGQWMRIACTALNSNEYHPFTIASAPHEETLSMFIRAVGPFTKNLRQIYDCNLLNGRPYPKLYIDGPYGEGHQDWLKFDVSVLVGGGIGITPFASIIKDISFRSSSNAKINCKKVYFLWVTRTQKHFEWMSDVIRETETKDRNNLLVSHIFITQFYEKFDLRTTMLYICERHFQRISNKSLFTGLKAKTHFGRPNFEVFFDSLQLEHPNVERVGVFSCGPGPMTNNVQQACESLNRKEGAIFIHHFENF